MAPDIAKITSPQVENHFSRVTALKFVSCSTYAVIEIWYLNSSFESVRHPRAF